jgi:hypothetical protein
MRGDIQQRAADMMVADVRRALAHSNTVITHRKLNVNMVGLHWLARAAPFHPVKSFL